MKSELLPAISRLHRNRYLKLVEFLGGLGFGAIVLLLLITRIESIDSGIYRVSIKGSNTTWVWNGSLARKEVRIVGTDCRCSLPKKNSIQLRSMSIASLPDFGSAKTF